MLIQLRIAIVFIFIIFQSCTKSVQTPLLVGEWRAIECLTANADGQNNTWLKLDQQDFQVLTFTESGEYLETNNTGTVQQVCVGTYKQLPAELLQITSSCQQEPLAVTISELTGSTLILDFTGREGVVRFRYVR